MKQADLGLDLSAKRMRKREFLEEMGRVVPWAKLTALVEAHYGAKGKASGVGRPPFALQTMLRIHFPQQWFALSDPAMGVALFDHPLFREFAQPPTGVTRPLDESTILRFRRLLERHGLAAQMLAAVNDNLRAKGLLLKAGTVVDATLIPAPSST
jgi:IS5 family transposase